MTSGLIQPDQLALVRHWSVDSSTASAQELAERLHKRIVSRVRHRAFCPSAFLYSWREHRSTLESLRRSAFVFFFSNLLKAHALSGSADAPDEGSGIAAECSTVPHQWALPTETQHRGKLRDRHRRAQLMRWERVRLRNV